MTKYAVRYSSNPLDAKAYGTERIRKEYLVQDIFLDDEVSMVYSVQERFIVGGVKPVSKKLTLETIDALKAPFFLYRREIGIINVGGNGVVTVDGQAYSLQFKEALYIGKGKQEITFESKDKSLPAKFYFNSAPAHKEFPVKHITLADAEVMEAGTAEESNARRINKLIVNSIVETCQLQMGLTELKPGSVWNTMPAHVHDRRNEVYFYFNMPENQRVCHFMGEPTETRHIWMKNEEAVISPTWSIHSGCGTSNYNFIWGMAGENLDYADMDPAKPVDLL